MKKFILLVIYSLFVSLSIYPQGGQYWLQRGGGIGNDEATSISIDASSNTYTTGYFSGAVQFTQNIQLISSGGTDIFVAKIDPQGQYVWVIKAGGNGPDRGLSIKTDSLGNSYITGFYQGTATFGTQTISSVGNSQDIFIAKYNTSGELQWVKSAGGSGGNSGNAITIDNAGSVYVTGHFNGIANFGITILTSMPDTSGAYSNDVFIAKYNAADGHEIWAKKGTSKFDNRGIDIACDATNNVYITGQFSDTITFDQTHKINMFNGIFLIKLNPVGQEQWFRYIGGSSQCIGYGLATDYNSDILLTGNYLNSLVFFGTPNYSLTNTYSKCVFVAKYESSGNLVWAKSLGSNDDVNSRDIAIDNQSNIYIAGNFKCKFNELSDEYGQGAFNSVGFWDTFVAKFESDGSFFWANQSGGRKDDKINGITLDYNNKIHVCGSFYESLYFPGSANFIYPNSNYNYLNNYSYYNPNCNEYDKFFKITSVGASDIFICKGYDTNKPPFYYYNHSNLTSCNRPFMGVEISNADTIVACGKTNLYANTNTGPAGPNFSYLWSNGSGSTQLNNISSSGTYGITLTSADGCFVSSDLVYVQIHPMPPKPPITDSKGINTNSLNPIQIKICLPDSVILYAQNLCNYCTGQWSGGNFSVVGQDSIKPLQTGLFTYTVTDTNNCVNTNKIWVIIDDSLTMPNITTTLTGSDTTICEGGFFEIKLDVTGTGSGTYHSTAWSSSPYTNKSPHTFYCLFYPTQEGLYQITSIHTVTLSNNCGSEILKFYDTIEVYITIKPKPVVNISISGNLTVCNTDTSIIHVNTNGDNIHWSGPSGFIPVDNQDSIIVFIPGHYSVSATIVENGCSTTEIVNFNFANYIPPTITIQPSNGLICPGDSVTLTCNEQGTYQWYGPNGYIGSQQIIYVNTPGLYYCVCVNIAGCTLTTNDIEIFQYNTPYLMASPNMICPGGQTTIEVVTNSGSTLQWQAPLSGSSFTQTVSNGGIYTCMITSCNITTSAHITIVELPANATITPNGPTNICPGDSVVLFGNSDAIEYAWTGGVTNNSITVHQPGTYTLTTLNNWGCTAVSAPVTVSMNPVPVPSASNTGPYCVGHTLQLMATGGAMYQWSGPSSFSSSAQNPTLSNVQQLNEGTYIVTVTNAQGCKATANTSITVDTHIPQPVVNNNSPICAGQTLQLYATGGTTYSWSGPVSFNTSIQNPSLFNTQTIHMGTYTVTATNACGSTPAATQVIINPNPTANITPNTAVMCAGDTLFMNGNPAGGSQTYIEYAWAGDVTPLSATNIVNPYFTTNNSDIYNLTYTVTDNNGCIGSSFVSVTVNPNPTANITPNTAVMCAGDTLFMNGNPAGGSQTYIEHAWVGDVTPLSATNIVNPYFTTHISGAYNLSYTVTDNNGCIGSSFVSVTVNSNPTANITPNPAVMCANDILYLYGNPTGGSQPFITHAWTGDTTLLTSTTDVNPNFSTNSSGIYQLNYTVTDDKGCIGSSSVTVTVNPNPTAAITPSPAVMCAGDTIYLNGNPTGGTLPLITNEWTGNVGPLSETNIMNPYFTTSNEGTYSLFFTITDNNGCMGNSFVSVTVNPNSTANITPNPAVMCAGDILFMDGNPAGGSQIYVNHAWAGDVTPLSATDSVSPYFTTINAGVYDLSYTVTDNNGCMGNSFVSVTVNPNPTANITPNPAVMCAGDTLFMDGSPTGGSHIFINHAWTGDVYSLSATDTVSPYFNTSVAATYTVFYTVTDNNGCVGSDTIAVLVHPNPLPVANNGGPYCLGDTIQTIQMQASGGNSYIWNGPVSFVSSLQNPEIVDAQLIHAGTYTVTVTDSNGCFSSTSTYVIVENNPIISITTSADSICEGDSLIITASGSQFYLWNNGQSTAQIIAFPTIATPTYQVTVSSINGCSSSAEVTATVHPIPNVYFTADLTENCDTLYTQFTNLSDSGAYLWTFGNGFASVEESPSAYYSQSGAYTVSLSVVTQFGCKNTDTKPDYIHVWPVPFAAFNPLSITYYEDDNSTIYFTDNSTGATKWYWNYGDSLSDNNEWTLQNNASHLYANSGLYTTTQIVSNEHGCTDTARGEIIIKPVPTFYIPNAFSPNSDGVNDFFGPYGTNLNLNNYEMYIYDRWGKIIFKSDDINFLWDGNIEGTLAPAGVYTWLINYSNNVEYNKHFKQKSGSVTLLR